MSKHHTRDQGTERRKFERIDIAPSKDVLVLDAKGKKAGRLIQLGRGGFMMEPEKVYVHDSKVHHFVIHEREEELHVQVSARVRYSDPHYVGFEFVDLDPESAVEVGILIGKYYEATQHRH